MSIHFSTRCTIYSINLYQFLSPNLLDEWNDHEEVVRVETQVDLGGGVLPAGWEVIDHEPSYFLLVTSIQHEEFVLKALP